MTTAEETTKPAEKNCHACAHSYMEPGTPHLICGHADSGPFGTYATIASVGLWPAGSLSAGPRTKHCGVERTKFVQHLLRNPDGTLKK